MSRYILILPKGGSEGNVGWISSSVNQHTEGNVGARFLYRTGRSSLNSAKRRPPPLVHLLKYSSACGSQWPLAWWTLRSLLPLPFDVRADTFSAARGLVKIHYPFVRILFPVREGIRGGSRAVEAPVAFLSLGRLDGGWRRS